ncbi:hypothetical protein N0V85_005703 [Neurospora sp. IMI 360204]|nr:hypothetical protein N0V85_005703 [Neurospora sp. IMI 360204]
MSHGSRVVGLSRYQPGVPTLLTSFSPIIDDVDPDAPPLSSDEESSAESKRGEITNTLRGKQREQRSTSASRDNGSPPGTDITTSSSTKPTTRQQKRLRNEVEDDQIEDEGFSTVQPAPKRTATERKMGQQQLGIQHQSSIFMPRANTSKRFSRKNNLRIPRDTKKPEPQTPKALKIPPAAGENGKADAPRLNFRIPDAIPGSSPTNVSSVTKLPTTNSGRPRVRPARSKLDKEKRKAEEEAKQRQPTILRIPEDFSSSFDLDKEEGMALEEADITLPILPSSPLKNLDFTLESHRKLVCPMCDEEVDESFMEELKARRTRLTLHQEQQFCQSHRKKSAKKEWADRGYPDIDWTVLDRRIKKHYDFLRTILNGGKSHYANVFSDRIKSGQNKTLLKSEANLTPGYYGMRGLRIMSENLVNNFSSELRNRAVQDRLVSKRGYMVYVQSVLVPELAVRLIMEDRIQQANQQVTEEEARNIMKDSVWVGELLNEEDADHVLYEDEEDDETQDDEMGLRDEDEAHLRYEYESKLKHEGDDKLKREDQGSAKQEDEDVKSNGNVVIHIKDEDKVKTEGQDDAKQKDENVKSNGNGISHVKDEEDDDKHSKTSSLSSLPDSDSDSDLSEL